MPGERMSPIRTVKKRDGSVQDFDPRRIGEAIRKAAEAQGWLEFEGEARRLQEIVVRRLEEKGYGEERIPSVEEIQDEVEGVLREEGYGTLAERYHEYRRRHDELRRSRSTLFDVGKMVEEFIGERDWRVRENANLRPSISSMMFNSAGAVNARYLLDRVYPPEVSDAHIDGDLHLHDLYQGICGYCCGHSMEDILTKGLVSVGNNPHSHPPKHLDVALMQVVNYIGVMTQEWAGAQAFSWIDVYLAPFIREDGLSDRQLKQLLQMFVYNLNVTSRWGGQCVSEDTEVLTEEGWKRYDELSMEDRIATLNPEKRRIEFLKLEGIHVYDYEGELILLKNRVTEQLVTPNHRILRKKFNSETLEFTEAEKLLAFDSSPILPIAGENEGKKEVDENLLRLCAWVIAEGTFSDGRGRIAIYQSEKHVENCERIRECLRALGLEWNEQKRKTGWSKAPCIRFRLKDRSSRWLKRFLPKKEIPRWMFDLPAKQIRLFLEEYARADGHVDKNGRIRLYTNDEKLLDGLQALAVLAGFGCTAKRNTGGTAWNVNLVRNSFTRITKIEKVKYRGKVWCPTTKNGTFVARRNKKVFITGNSPFSNVTLACGVPEPLRGKPAVIGGRPLDKTYEE
ncbi:MAG: anaerobic ribonucleoside-triphosphate reductase, partial [Candidatus Hadarchaeales archaeon]